MFPSVLEAGVAAMTRNTDSDEGESSSDGEEAEMEDPIRTPFTPSLDATFSPAQTREVSRLVARLRETRSRETQPTLREISVNTTVPLLRAPFWPPESPPAVQTMVEHPLSSLPGNCLLYTLTLPTTSRV